MKPLVQFGLCCLLAPGVFAQHHGGGAVSGGHSASGIAGHHAGHAPVSIRSFGYGRHTGYGGYSYYGYGGFYGGYYEPFYDYADGPPEPVGGSNVTVVDPVPAPPVTIAPIPRNSMIDPRLDAFDSHGGRLPASDTEAGDTALTTTGFQR